ncbi:MAG: hypothetical protein WC352_00285 [Candidatus Omnitrophota bacterium]|jgi:hypothetical protein
MMKRAVVLAVVLGLAIPAPSVWASAKTFGHKVTIEVPPSLDLAGSQQDFTLAFPNTSSGSETNAVTIQYTMNSNGMMQASGAPAVMAQLDGVFPGVDVRAQVGAFSKMAGDTELIPASSSYITVRDSAVPLAMKGSSTGTGRVLSGTLPVTYKAVATSDLASGVYARQLTLTLTDI